MKQSKNLYQIIYTKKIIPFLYFLFFFTTVFPQGTSKKLNIKEVIDIAHEQSPDALMAKHRFKASYWQFRSYKAEFLPSLSLSATLPDLNRSISKITLPDGSDAFVDRKLINSSADLSLTQNVSLTGGSFFIKSGLQRIDLLNDSTATSYLSTPISIGYTQPLIFYNNYKWLKKIEPLKYEEAKKRYISALEDVSLKAVGLFYDLALAIINYQIAEINYSNNDTLFKMSKGRYELGKIAENDLLQMEYNLLNSDADLSQSKIDLEVKKYKLRSFLSYTEKTAIDLEISGVLPSLQVDVQKALAEAKVSNPDIMQYQRQMLEADQDVAKTKAESMFNANLYASYGLTQSSDIFKDAYNKPKDQQRVSVGIQIPILDWGLAKGKYKMAQSSREVIRVTLEQAQIDFEQDVFLKVMQFNIQSKQVAIAAKADTISQIRFDVAKNRYYIGKIDVTALNIALTDKDVAKRSYIATLRSYWSYFFTIRKISLYDFEKNQSLSIDFKKLEE